MTEHNGPMTDRAATPHPQHKEHEEKTSARVGGERLVAESSYRIERRGSSVLTVGSLFAGIGGFDLGFERAGFQIQWQVEIDLWCRAVLMKHWPQVQRFDDVRECCAGKLRISRTDGRCAECGRRDFLSAVTVLCGGFPCQDISFAGHGDGLDGAQSGLWFDMLRVIRELRPRYVVVENVAALLYRGLGDVLSGLAAGGFDAEWECLPASAFGAPHIRDRLFIVAYPQEFRWPRSARIFTESAKGELGRNHRVAWGSGLDQSAVPRVATRLPDQLDRLGGLGNSIVPQIAEWIARRIKEAEAE